MLQGTDTFVCHPTGSGKSLAFQIPPVVSGRLSLVLTPTISLMIDQAEQLRQKGIRATYLGSCQKDKEIYTKIASKAFSVVFLIPESLFDPTGIPRHFFKCLASEGLLDLIAIDKVHLVMTWKAFR